MSLKIIISGGGTGGHIYPAVAIANELKIQKPDTEILFVGAEGKMEMEKVPKAGFEIIGLPIAGINRSNLLSNIGFPLKLIKSLWKAYKVVKEFKPDAAIGVGGYASGPTLLMANFLGVKTLLQEQNSYAGITNKKLSKSALKICVAYPNMEKFFPKEKIVFTGNPVRKDILSIENKREAALAKFGLNTNKKTLLIIGGSQGARSINLAINQGIKELLANDIQVIWQTGTSFISEARKTVESLTKNSVYVSDFIYEMDLAYAACDFVVSRAGALSVSELCLAAKPSILVPFPQAAEDHQTQNAMSLVNYDAAWLVTDKNTGSELINKTIELSKNEKTLNDLSQNIAKFAKPNAAKEIVEVITQML
jgi:UDP-N-acetylglucosamine--N-acetylmuramyl-(pentapeptide) pyrophosphoryl-undecaprenol N-acetylglucosamine transferase